jgi:Spy/CpxP family protein refolding chaperone
MRKTSLSKIMLLAALSLGAAYAQGDRPPHDGMGGAADTATSIDRRIAYLKALLTLTDAQVASATTIYTNAAATITPLQTSLATARESLTTAIKGNATATIDSVSTQIGSLNGQITAAQSKATAAFYALLTADQRTRFDAVDGGRRGGGPGRF